VNANKTRLCGVDSLCVVARFWVHVFCGHVGFDVGDFCKVYVVV
jgi:hypothetical protein